MRDEASHTKLASSRRSQAPLTRWAHGLPRVFSSPRCLFLA